MSKFDWYLRSLQHIYIYSTIRVVQTYRVLWNVFSCWKRMVMSYWAHEDYWNAWQGCQETPLKHAGLPWKWTVLPSKEAIKIQMPWTRWMLVCGDSVKFKLHCWCHFGEENFGIFCTCTYCYWTISLHGRRNVILWGAHDYKYAAVREGLGVCPHRQFSTHTLYITIYCIGHSNCMYMTVLSNASIKYQDQEYGGKNL